jgi:hypothetical protein
MIETVFSAVDGARGPEELDRLVRQPRREPFDATAIEFVSTLSSRILRSPLAREHPELAALAHWFRRANVLSIANRSRGAGGAPSVRPRGLVFVIAPANVDVLFIYGWLLSLLAGNASIVRVSQRASPLRDAFLGVVRETVAENPFASAVADSWLVTYAHDDSITASISAVCDARLVWGGDATVSRIRAIPIKPVAVEAGFADRFSFAVFSAKQMCAEDEATLREIARRFANDTLWFSQQACSSPRAVFWIGDAPRAKEARERFWRLYEAAAATFENEPAAVMSRATDLFMLAGEGAIDGLSTPLAALPARASGSSTLAHVREIHSGHGMFVEYTVHALRGVAGLMEDKDQTVVAHGFDAAEIDLLLRSLPNRAVDRIVSPGQATDFSTVWDGSELVDILTRKVVVSLRTPTGPAG